MKRLAWRFHKSILGLMVAALMAITTVGQPAQAAPLDYDITDGHFFTQANGQGGAGGLGYKISNADGIPFWTDFQRRGGVDVLGYPVSHRFEWRGTVVQALQKAVLQWQPDAQQVAYVNVFDELGAAGKDDWLKDVRATPKWAWLPNEANLSWNEVMRGRQAFLDPFPAIKARYFSVPDPLRLYGLPASRVEDMGPAYVVRLQRAVIQQWKINTPWARAGEVTVANGGDVAKETGIFPSPSIEPQSAGAGPAPMPSNIPQARRRLVVALDPGHGGSETGAVFQFPGGTSLKEKDVNLPVALKAGELLRRAGYEVVFTRTQDTRVNSANRDLNNSRSVNVEDDLQARVDIANAAGAAILVSIHHNGSSNRAMRGTEVYYASDRPFAAQSRRLAQQIQNNLVQALRASGYNSPDRGVKTDRSALGGGHFFLLGPASRLIARPSKMPAALGEALFVSNAVEADLLRRPETINALASGYAAGIAQYLAASQ